jgi:MFS family permease
MINKISRKAEVFRSFCDGIGATAVIYPAALFTSFALGLTNLGIVFFARDIFNASPVEIGWLAGTWALAYTISCITLRPLFGHLPARYLIITSSSLMFACILAMQFVSSLVYVFLFFALYGVSMSMFWPPLMAWLSDGHEGKVLGSRFSRYNIMWSFGSILSPYMCGWMAERSARYPLFLGSGIFLITAAFVSGAAIVLPKASQSNSAAADSNTETGERSAESAMRFPAWVGLFATFFGFGAILSIFPLAAKTELSMTESTIGLLFLVRALLSAATFFFIGKTIFWHFRALPMLTGQIITLICFILLCFFNTTILTGLLFGILGVSSAFSYSVSVFHGVTGSADRVKRMSIHESTLAFGLISGSAAGGMLYEAHSMSHVYALCTAILFAGLIIQVVMQRSLCKTNTA